MHMLEKANDKNTELKRYLESVKASEATKIPQKSEDKKPEYVDKEKPDWHDKKNDDFNEYDYSNDMETDDKDW